MEGGPKIKTGAGDLPRYPIADKFLHVALVPVNNTYQHTNFQLPNLMCFEDVEGVPK